MAQLEGGPAMTGRLIALSLAFAVLAAAPAPAPAQPAYYGLCQQSDLKGVWQLSSIRAAEPGVEAFYKAHPIEYLRFKPDGTYIYVAMNAELPNLDAINASLDRADRA